MTLLTYLSAGLALLSLMLVVTPDGYFARKRRRVLINSTAVVLLWPVCAAIILFHMLTGRHR